MPLPGVKKNMENKGMGLLLLPILFMLRQIDYGQNSESDFVMTAKS